MLVTGSGGFIGRTLVPVLVKQGHRVLRWPSADPAFDLGHSGARPHWIEKMRGIDTVVHLAAHVHQLQPRADDADQARRINRDGSVRLAEAALAAGVKRFVFISTAKVFGEGTSTPYTPASAALPGDAYARSKWEAEQQLQRLTADTPMQLVIIRPPLVYGRGAGANFARLQRLARLPLPLPLSGVRNRRDMIGIDNLVDLIALCTHAPAAAGGTWLCSDGGAYSLAQVVGMLRRAAGMRPLLFFAPPAWVARAAELALGHAAAQRLFGNFELDISATRTLLDWSPPYSMLSVLQRDGETPR